MAYVLASVNSDGQIRALNCAVRDVYYSDPDKIVHRESRRIDTWGATCYDKLVDAKAHRTGDNVILALDKEGGACAVWTLPEQRELVIERLSKWKGCYGAWPVRKLNG